MAAAGVGGADAADGDAAQKRVRALQKKLRQIQQLKDKRDKEGTWEREGRKGASLVAGVEQEVWPAFC